MSIAIIAISIIDVDVQINPVTIFYVFSNIIWNVYMLDYPHQSSPASICLRVILQ